MNGKLRIKDLFELVSVSCDDNDQLVFLRDSKRFFLSEPLRYWPFYGLVGLVGLSAVIFGLVSLAYFLVIVNLFVFFVHFFYSRFLYSRLIVKWRKKLKSLED